ncbi:EutN/CcmL family microcompartment protein [Clostridium sp.]|uniref:EutN/CcmL family microcompartment protein n=1 Tax=Clostridium sp. TaxID=1506 RepID=UPI002FCC46F6
MEIGRVVGNLWATRKDEKLSGQRFLVVKILESKDTVKNGLFVACDNVGAGNGDLVLITKGGAARQAIGVKDVPVDATIVGIIDSLDIDDE